MSDDILDELVRAERKTKLERLAKLCGTFGWSEERAVGFLHGLTRNVSALETIDVHIDEMCEKYQTIRAQAPLKHDERP